MLPLPCAVNDAVTLCLLTMYTAYPAAVHGRCRRLRTDAQLYFHGAADLADLALAIAAHSSGNANAFAINSFGGGIRRERGAGRRPPRHAPPLLLLRETTSLSAAASGAYAPGWSSRIECLTPTLMLNRIQQLRLATIQSQTVIQHEQAAFSDKPRLAAS